MRAYYGALPVGKELRLAIIITGLDIGGAEVMLLKLLERLDSRFSVNVISLTTMGEIGPRIQALGIPVEAIGMKAGALNILAFRRLVQRLKVLDPHLVHTWMYHADFMGGLAARFSRVPVVVWEIVQSNLSQSMNKWTTLVVARACAFLSKWVPNRIISCSDVGRRIHIDYGYSSEKIIVVPLGFDLCCYKPDSAARVSLRQELDLDKDAALVGLVGRYDPQKNHLGFVDAISRIHKKRRDIHFVMVGKNVDTMNAELVEAVTDARVGKVAHLLGLRQDMPRLMAALDALASASFGEGFPNVLCEAMASGVPCAVTDVGDSAYIVGDTGRVVPSGDMEALSEALLELLEMDPENRQKLSVSARARVAENFELGHIVRLYETLYDEISNGIRIDKV